MFLHEGHVVVRAGNSEIKTQKTFNDDNTHYVSIYSNVNGWVVLHVTSNLGTNVVVGESVR